jgi:hypothetical protein
MSQVSLGSYAIEAFNFRPGGMFVAPNWVFLAGVGLLATQEPAIALIGAGLELAYLLSLVSHPAFRRWVERKRGGRDAASEEKELEATLRALGGDALQRFRALRDRCEAVLDALPDDAPVEAVAHESAALERLMQVYLALLRTEHGLGALLRQADPGVRDELASVQRRLAADGLDEALRTSLEHQRDLLVERIRNYDTARQRVDHARAELARIEQQVALWREQRLFEAQGGTGAVSGRIDQLLGSLKPTDDWLREQRALVGEEPAEQKRVPVRRRAERT